MIVAPSILRVISRNGDVTGSIRKLFGGKKKGEGEKVIIHTRNERRKCFERMERGCKIIFLIPLFNSLSLSLSF